MEKTAIFSKTAKGLREVEGKTKALPRNLRSLLKEVDGTTPFGDLVGRLADDWPESDLQRGLSYLVSEGFIRELILEAHSIPQTPGRLLLRIPKLQSSAPSQGDDSLEDLDFTSELPATVTKAEEKARREAEERARKEAEEKARREAEEKAKREAEERARKEAEEKAKREAEEKAKREAEEKAKREAEEKARIEEKSRLAAARIHSERREPIKWGSRVALGFVVLVAMVIVAVNLISFESRIPDFERAASAWFQQPVKIKSLRVAFLPQAQWQLEGVAIGSAGQILAPRINVPTSYAALFDKSNMTFESLLIDAPAIGTEGMGWLLFGRSRPPGLQIRHVQASNIKFAVPGMRLPAFDATMEIDADGNWQKIGMVAMEKKVEVQLTAGKVVRLEMKLSQSALPFGALPMLDDLTAAGTLDRRSLLLDEFNASLSGGSLRGRARVVWGADAILDGEVTARGIDMGQMLAGFMEGGRLEGKANFSLPISGDGRTGAAARLTGDFAIDRGTLATVDFGRMVKGESGGRTQFKKLTGRVAHRGGETQLRELFVDAGKLTAKGSADIDAGRDIQGQFFVSLNLGAARQRVSIALSGPFKAPYKDLKWE